MSRKRIQNQDCPNARQVKRSHTYLPPSRVEFRNKLTKISLQGRRQQSDHQNVYYQFFNL